MRGTAASLPAPLKTEHKRARFGLAAAFWSRLWLSFFGKAWGQGNWVGWQMVLNRKGGSVCLQTWRGVVPLLPGALDKISVGASCQLPQPRIAARQMNQRQPGGSSLPREPPCEGDEPGQNAAQTRCQAPTRTALPRFSRLARGTGSLPSASLRL